MADDVVDLDCKLGDDDVRRVIGKVNGVWHKAGIHFMLESIRHEPAARREALRAAREKGQWPPMALYRLLRPEDSRRFDGVQVYYVHALPVNGMYLGDDFAFVKETAELRPVDGGIDEPIPRVTAHELGHALGLEHRQDRTNLMASGTTGTLLNAAEMAKAREGAGKKKGSMTTAEAWKAAEQASEKVDGETAVRLWTALAEIPGTGAAAAKQRVAAAAPQSRPTTRPVK